jgi:molybdopterin-containing oxidoreductase family iron-sulfur binding subunit
VVGKEQVAKGRDMQWLRVDRYYSGDPEEPEVSQQLMLCQHCDDAPCENVCPVAATTHSPDGLNQMVYNRCVGTRYCSNNCPYKVRRFNYFNFRDHFNDGYQQSPIFDLVFNPEVTVRSRGVMEKCTFCVQRIMEAREDATRENKPLKGSDVHTACQDACITTAIHFGDMHDPSSEINKYRNHKLGYHVLENLNTRPNVTYIAKLRNTDKDDA